jgi:hypothetical protein
MHNKKWTDEDTRWLKANRERMDLQSLSHSLGFPLAEVEAQLKLIQKAPSRPNTAPGTLKEAVGTSPRGATTRPSSLPQEEVRRGGQALEEVLEKHPDEKGHPRPRAHVPRGLEQEEGRDERARR